MKMEISSPLLLKPFIILIFFITLSFLIFLSVQNPITNFKKFNPNTSQVEDQSLPPGIKIRPGYPTYDAYLQRQLNKTLNPKLRQIWTTRDWDRKVRIFSQFFESLKSRNLLSNQSRSLCIGARVGQEVAALRAIGVADAVGIDLVPRPPLVLRGDFHRQPFDDGRFDFEFSNVFDHALYPWRFAGEIERTLRPGGVCVLHVLLARRADKYSANDLYGVDGLKKLFRKSEVVEVRAIDGFGLDTEVVFRKKLN